MNLSDTDTTNLVAVVSAALGAFLGSGSAFLLEARRRKREEVETRYSSLFQTQLILVTQLNGLLNIQKQSLNEFRSDPNRFMKLAPFFTGFTEMRIDFKSLWFLPLEDDPEVLHRIFLAECAYCNALQALTMRNQKMETELYSPEVKVESFDWETGRSLIQMDPRKARLIKVLTDSLYENVDDAAKQQEKAVEDLRGVIKRLFPGRKSLQFVEQRH